MTDDEKLDKIERLRKELGSKRLSEASRDADADATVGTRTYGSGLQALFGQSGESATNVRTLGTGARVSLGDERSSDEESIRERSGFVGLSDNHSRSNSVAAKIRSSGGLVSEDVIPRRNFQEGANEVVQEDTKDSQGKGYRAKASRTAQSRSTRAKGTATRSKDGEIPSSSGESDGNKGRIKAGPGWKLPSLAEVPGIGKGKTLNKREADELKDGFRTALADDFGYIDSWLRTRTGDPMLQVWSDVDDEELDKVTEVFLRGAQRSPVLATVVRETINTHDYIVTGLVFLPRIGKTVQILRDSRKAQAQKPRRWERMAQQRQQAGVNGHAE